jgi:hypothetical protein
MDNIENKDLKKKGPFKFALPLILLLVAGIIGFGVYEYFRIAPRDVRFTNVTSSSVTVSWNTKAPTSATALAFKGDTLLPLTVLGLGGERFYDTRDVKVAELDAASEAGMNRDDFSLTIDDFQTEVVVEEMGEYYTHHVTVTGLDPETEYSFMVGDGLLYKKAKDANGLSALETLIVPSEIKSPSPAYGSIMNAQGSEDPGLLIPLSDGVVYFNFIDEITGNRSTRHSGVLNEEGNWYIDISNIRVLEGEDFLGKDVITNVTGEISIDAGPDGKWEGVLTRMAIAPAEMIVINDPLQKPVESVGIRRIQSIFPGTFTLGVEAQSPVCNFAGYCGPCYATSYDDACPCPQATLDSRPGCKGQEDGTTLQEARSAVATQTNPDSAVGRCSNDGKKGDHVYFSGACRVCAWDDSKKGWLWTTNGVNENDCSDKGGSIIKAENGLQNYPITIDNPIGDLEVGEECVRAGKKGIVADTTVCPDGEDSCKYCRILVEVPVPDPDDPVLGAPCEKNGSGLWNNRNGSLVCDIPSDSCYSGYQYVFDSDLGIGTCVLEGTGDKDPEASRTISCLCGDRSATFTNIPAAIDSWNRLEAQLGKFKGDQDLTTSYCASGCIPDKEPHFPLSGNSVEWSCTGYNKQSVSCLAKRTEDNQNAEEISITNEIRGDLVLYKLRGELCPRTDGGRDVVACICNNVTDINPGDYCPESGYDKETLRCSRGSREGDICDVDGTTCAYKNFLSGTLRCIGDPPAGSYNINDKGKDLFSFVTQALAQAPKEDTYVIDSQAGLFVGLEAGSYLVDYKGEVYLFEVKTKGKIVDNLLYVDINDNGKYDETIDVNISEYPDEIKVSPLEVAYDYNLKEGFNFVSFPFLIKTIDDYSTAASLLKQLNSQYDNVFYSISKYDGRWKMVGQNTEMYDANDFQLLPGQGYVIKAKEDVSITLTGRPVKYESVGDNAPVTLFEGWNLIGIYGTGVKTYTAKTMIADINAANFTADNVSKWAKEKQSYEGFQFSEEQEYGFDFPINTLESVFVRVLEGRGNWQPKLGSQ